MHKEMIISCNIVNRKLGTSRLCFRMILKWILMTIYLAQDRIHW